MAIINDRYATVEAYRSRLTKRDVRNDDDIEEDIIAICRWLDLKMKRFFWQEDTAVAREFETVTSLQGLPFNWAESENPYRYMRTAPELPVDDIANTTGLVIKLDTNRDHTFATTFASTDYELLPRNAQHGPEPKPYTTIHLPSWSSVRVWPPATLVQVTACWGWPAVPKAVERAVIDVVGILRLESPRATHVVNRSIGEMAETSQEAQDILKSLIHAYMKPVYKW